MRLKQINPLVLFQNQYFSFILALVAIIVCNQVIIQYDLSQQNYDAKLINLTGRQRMLTQSLMKSMLEFSIDLERQIPINSTDLNQLKQDVTTFEKVHFD